MSCEVVQSHGATPGESFLQASTSSLENGLHKIRHCVAQLSFDELWSEPAPGMNSVANLLLHLSGNLRQWIISGAGGAPDLRDRSAEFDDRSLRSAESLLDELSGVIAECTRVFQRLSPHELVERRVVQGFDVQVLAGIYDAVAHFKGHVQEIVHITRRTRGGDYRFDFVAAGEKAPE